MTSTARSVMRLASSWMVITSGMITSRDDLLARPSAGRWPRSRARGGGGSEASERSRCSSSSALATVSWPRARRSSPPACARAWPSRRSCRRGRCVRGPSSLFLGRGGACAGRARCRDRRFVAEALARLVLGLALALFLGRAARVLVALARFGGLALGAARRPRARRGGAHRPRRRGAPPPRARARRPAPCARRVASRPR